MTTKADTHGYRVAFKIWDKGKGDAMQLCEYSTKWFSYDEARQWIDSHYFDTANILDRSTGKSVGIFGNSQDTCVVCGKDSTVNHSECSKASMTDLERYITEAGEYDHKV